MICLQQINSVFSCNKNPHCVLRNVNNLWKSTHYCHTNIYLDILWSITIASRELIWVTFSMTLDLKSNVLWWLESWRRFATFFPEFVIQCGVEHFKTSLLYNTCMSKVSQWQDDQNDRVQDAHGPLCYETEHFITHQVWGVVWSREITEIITVSIVAA